jgi:hypothetical protein
VQVDLDMDIQGGHLSKKKGTEWAGRVAPVVGHMCFLLRVKLHLLIDAKYFSKLLSRS